MNKKFKSAISKLRNEYDFVLINFNGRPVFVRPLDKDEEGCKCNHNKCKRKALMKIFEIDKEKHYSDWECCGRIECDID